MSGRIPKCICVVGTNGTGKTYTLKEIARNELKKGGRVLVLTAHENEWTEIDGIPIADCADIKNFKGIARIHITGELKILQEIRKKFHNGIVILDDARMYVKSNIGEEFKQLLISRKQMMCDILLAAHSITDIPPSVFFYNVTFILKKTTSQFLERKNKLMPEVYEALTKAQNEVNQKAKKNPYYQIILEI